MPIPVDQPAPKDDSVQAERTHPILSTIRTMQAAGPCPHGGEIVDSTIGLCSCGKCPTPRPGWTVK